MREKSIPIRINKVCRAEPTERGSDIAEDRYSIPDRRHPAAGPQRRKRLEQYAKSDLGIGLADWLKSSPAPSHPLIDCREPAIMSESVHAAAKLPKKRLRVAQRNRALGCAPDVRQDGITAQPALLNERDPIAFSRVLWLFVETNIFILVEREAPAIDRVGVPAAMFRKNVQ
jgi:hypothetical protein